MDKVNVIACFILGGCVGYCAYMLSTWNNVYLPPCCGGGCGIMPSYEECMPNMISVFLTLLSFCLLFLGCYNLIKDGVFKHD